MSSYPYLNDFYWVSIAAMKPLKHDPNCLLSASDI